MTVILAIIIVVYIVHATIESIILYNCIECSAPWYAATLMTTLIYIGPICLLIVIKVYYVFKIKNGNEL